MVPLVLETGGEYHCGSIETRFRRFVNHVEGSCNAEKNFAFSRRNQLSFHLFLYQGSGSSTYPILDHRQHGVCSTITVRI